MKLSEAIERAEILIEDCETMGLLAEGYLESAEVLQTILDAIRWPKWPEEKPNPGQLCLTRDADSDKYRVQTYGVDYDGWSAYQSSHWLPINGPEVGK